MPHGLAIKTQHGGDVSLGSCRGGSCRPWVRGGTEYTCAGTLCTGSGVLPRGLLPPWETGFLPRGLLPPWETGFLPRGLLPPWETALAGWRGSEPTI